MVAEWAEELYEARKPLIIEEVNSRFCGVTEWVEQPMPRNEEDIREVLMRSGPFLRKEVIEGIAKDTESLQNAKKPLDVLCLGDASGLGASILSSLEGRGMLGKKSKTVEVWREVYEAGRASMETAQEWLEEGPWDVILITAAADPPLSNDPDDIVAWSDCLVKLTMYLGQALLRAPSSLKKGLCVVTTGVFANDRENQSKAGLGVCCGGFFFGMLNTMRWEMPDTRMHYVDCDYELDDETVDELGYELTRTLGFGENSVRLTKNSRFVCRQVQAEPKYSTDAIFETPKAGVVAIGGGNGALGLVMGKYLLEKYDQAAGDAEKKSVLTLKFLSRSCKISGDGNLKLWDEVKKLAEDKCVKVEQVSCDVSRRDAVVAFVDAHRADLVGFIHSAGVLRDGLLLNQTSEKYDDVYKPKAWAGVYMAHALEVCLKLKFFWMFSSVAVFGNQGQSNYSGANACLDAIARHRKALGKPAQVMQWAGWGEVGMAAGLEGLAKTRMEQSPIPFFTNAQGLAGMDVGLSTGVPVFCVMRYNTEAFLKDVNKKNKKPFDRHFAKFWGAQAPAKHMDYLDLYEQVVHQFVAPKYLLYDFFVDHIQDPSHIHDPRVRPAPYLRYDQDIPDKEDKPKQ